MINGQYFQASNLLFCLPSTCHITCFTISLHINLCRRVCIFVTYYEHVCDFSAPSIRVVNLLINISTVIALTYGLGAASRTNCISLRRVHEPFSHLRGSLMDGLIVKLRSSRVHYLDGGKKNCIPQRQPLCSCGTMLSNVNYFPEGRLQRPRSGPSEAYRHRSSVWMQRRSCVFLGALWCLAPAPNICGHHNAVSVQQINPL